MTPADVRVYAGPAALVIQLRFCVDVLWKWLFQRRRYPLLRLSRSRNGFLRTLELLSRARLDRVIRVGRHYHFSLLEPRWPSPAYERLVARGGLSLGAAGTPDKAQIDLVILAVTRACAYHCAHCYEHYNLGAGEAVSVERWAGVIREIQEVGVSVVVLSGGEPLLRFEDTLRLVATSDKRRSDVHLHTTGHGATPERVRALAAAGLVAAGVGFDDHDRARFDALRGRRGAFDDAVAALRLFREAGLLTYVNVCLTRDLVRDDGLFRLLELLHGLDVGALQLLEPKPCGRLASRDLDELFGAADRRAVRSFFDAVHRERRYGRHPAVYYPAFIEAPENLGCMMGGLSHLHVDSLGNVQPCVFLPVSFGNLREESFASVYGRMREAVPRPLRSGCAARLLADEVGFDPARQPRLPIPYASVREAWARMWR